MAGPPIYEIRSLEHNYGKKTVLSIDRLTVRRASIVGIVGPNGSGKSTLLRIMGLIEKPARGELLFHDRPVAPFADHARFRIALLPQEPFLMKRSVYRNVAYGLKLRGVRRTSDRVREALGRVGLDHDDFAGRPWFALSGGEAQRVALAARLALEPEILLLDEPTSGVDALSAQAIKDAILRARAESGAAMVIASHDWQWLHEVCDEIVHMFRGKILGQGAMTIIQGPWLELTPRQWGRTLSDNQVMRVSNPPGAEAAAVIHGLAIGGELSGKKPGEVLLRGTVSRLGLEKQSGKIFASILAGNLPFTVCLSVEQARERTVFPGKEVCIRYRIDQVEWI